MLLSRVRAVDKMIDTPPLLSTVFSGLSTHSVFSSYIFISLNYLTPKLIQQHTSVSNRNNSVIFVLSEKYIADCSLGQKGIELAAFGLTDHL